MAAQKADRTGLRAQDPLGYASQAAARMLDKMSSHVKQHREWKLAGLTLVSVHAGRLALPCAHLQNQMPETCAGQRRHCYVLRLLFVGLRECYSAQTQLVLKVPLGTRMSDELINFRGCFSSNLS